MRPKVTESCNRRYVSYSGQINTVLYSDSDRARFAARVNRRGDHACWFWASTQPNHYGTFWAQGAPKYAHRVAWELANGPIPAGQSVLHRCDQPNCVNPAHLFLGDHTANMRDAASKRRLSVSRPAAHKVSDAACDAIVARVAAGERQCDVAAEYGVTRAFVSLLMKGKRRQYRKAS